MLTSIRRSAALVAIGALALCVMLAGSGCGSDAPPSSTPAVATSPSLPPRATPTEESPETPTSTPPPGKPELASIPQSTAEDVAQSVLTSFVLASDYANAEQFVERCRQRDNSPTYECYTPLIFGDDLDGGTQTCDWVVEVGQLTDGRYVRRVADLSECRRAAGEAGGSVGPGDWEQWRVVEG